MNSRQIAHKVWTDPVYFIAFGFGTGLMPKAPGTWGTLIAIPLYLLIADLSPISYLIITGLSFIAGSWIAQRVSRELGEHDYGGIVWDEVVGYWLTMFMAPHGLVWIILGFILFRIFDILKPQPIRYIDRQVKGGFGIMLDDLLAAIPAWLILQTLAWSFLR